MQTVHKNKNTVKVQKNHKYKKSKKHQYTNTAIEHNNQQQMQLTHSKKIKNTKIRTIKT